MIDADPPTSTFTAAAAPSAVEVLLDLARRSQQANDSAEVLGLMLDAALAVSGARYGAVLQRVDRDGLEVLADRGSGLPGRMSIGDVRASLWGVLLGRTRLAWRREDATPSPFDGVDGWEDGGVVRVSSRGGSTKLLALGGIDAPLDAAMDQLQAIADIASPAVECLELTSGTRRSQALLRGVTRLAGSLGAAVTPAQLLQAITGGLTDMRAVDAARVWAPGDVDGPPVVVAGAEHGALPDHASVLARVGRLLDPDAAEAVREVIERPARSRPDAPFVTLQRLDTDPPRVLGLVHAEPLDDLARTVLASLVAAIAPAMREVEMAQERRTLLSGYTASLRPSARPEGLELAVEHHPNTSAPGSFGGDFYDWFDVDDEHAVIALGDVSGKGINAASAASMVVWSLRAIGGRGAQPTVITHLLNGVVDRELDADRFVTLALLTLDTRTWEGRVLLSGHPAPLVVGEGSARVVEATAGPPLGILDIGTAAPPVAVALEVGEAMVLFTDGVTEAVAEGGEMLGVERVRARAAELTADDSWSAKSLAAGLWQQVQDWAGGPPDDDCAILVVRRPR